ncbi:MAG TPA: serine hydrolase [Rhodothermales bacterium]|nr:serine hydrolase [Rhodothermales bacterium]
MVTMRERRTRRPYGWILTLAVFVLAGCVASRPASAPAESLAERQARLQRALDEAVRGFGGVAGIYVRHLGTGEEAAVNADTLFPTASMIKVPIMVAVFDAIERGELRYDQPHVYRDSLLYPGEDILGGFRDSVTIPLSQVQMLSITTSDNTASLWLQYLAGTGTKINEWLAAHGFEGTRMNSRTPGRRGDWQRYGWGQTTPREMARLVTMIRQGQAVSPGADEEMYRILTRIYWNDDALSMLPPTVQAASKQGAVNRSRSEVVLVNAPHGDYVFCVITKNQTDESWERSNEGWRLIRHVSGLLWQHFEPDYGWTPPAGTRY